MKLTILGNYGPYPTNNGNLSGYAVEDNDFLMLLDMGSGTLSKFLSKFDIKKLDAIFISHYILTTRPTYFLLGIYWTQSAKKSPFSPNLATPNITKSYLITH